MHRFVYAILVGVGIASFTFSGLAQQTPSGSACAIIDRSLGTPTASGLEFSGEAGEHVSETFSLPEGTIVYSSRGSEFWSSFEVVPAPGSAGSLRNDRGAVGVNRIDADEANGVITVESAGEFVLVVKADREWWVVLEF